MTELEPGIALDIDETLSITGLHWTKDFIELYGNPDNLSAKEALQACYYQKRQVNNWDLELFKSFMLERSNSKQMVSDLPMIENAHQAVQKINDMLHISCYITARPDTVQEETTDWLDRHGFPHRPVISRPARVDHFQGNEWKAGVLQELFPTIRGIVDDNPNLISALSPNYEGTIFLYDHLDYDKETTINVVPCKDWDHVYTEIRRMAILFGIQ